MGTLANRCTCIQQYCKLCRADVQQNVEKTLCLSFMYNMKNDFQRNVFQLSSNNLPMHVTLSIVFRYERIRTCVFVHYEYNLYNSPKCKMVHQLLIISLSNYLVKPTKPSPTCPPMVGTHNTH